MPINTVGVIGAGTMGNGIAHVFAKSGFRVLLRDVEQGFLDRALQTISKNLEREVSKDGAALPQKSVVPRLASLNLKLPRPIPQQKSAERTVALQSNPAVWGGRAHQVMVLAADLRTSGESRDAP